MRLSRRRLEDETGESKRTECGERRKQSFGLRASEKVWSADRLGLFKRALFQGEIFLSELCQAKIFHQVSMFQTECQFAIGFAASTAWPEREFAFRACLALDRGAVFGHPP